MLAPLLVVALLSGQTFQDVEGPIFSDPASMSSGTLFRLRPMSAGDLTWGSTSGVAGTTTRASVATCPMPDGGITSLTANQPCITCVNGVCGLYSELSSTNYLLQSEDLTSASWASTNASVIVTANTGDCGNGANSMDTVDMTSATTSSEFRYQTVSVSSSTGPFTHSQYVRPVGASNVAEIGMNATGGWATCTCTVSSGTCTTDKTTDANKCIAYATVTGLVRMTVSGTTSSAVTSVLPLTGGGRIGTSKDKAIFGCGNMEANGTTYATTYIPTTTATVTRAGVKHEFPTPAALSRTEGCARVTVTPIWTGGNPLLTTIWELNANAAGTARLVSTGGTNDQISIVGGVNATIAAGFTANTPKTYRTAWSASTGNLTADNTTAGTTSSTAGFTSLGAFDSTISVGGNYGGNQPIGAIIGNVSLGASASGCQR